MKRQVGYCVPHVHLATPVTGMKPVIAADPLPKPTRAGTCTRSSKWSARYALGAPRKSVGLLADGVCVLIERCVLKCKWELCVCESDFTVLNVVKLSDGRARYCHTKG